MPYTVKDGIIYTSACEIAIVQNCNISCRSCGHLSPLLEKDCLSPEQVFQDLSVLAKYYHCEHVRLLGGEPLLHPQLLDIVNAVRQTGICDRIRLVTNGLILWKMADPLWEALDQVYVSVYPGRAMTSAHLDICKQKAKQYNVELEFFNFDYFRESYSELGTNDQELVGRIYKTCQMAQHWGCYNVYEGYFYKCPESIFLSRFLPNNPSSKPTVDGIKIEDSPNFAQNLLAYLESPTPLASCKYCLGTVGKLFPHEQISRKHWREPQQHPIEELVDLEYLSRLENEGLDIFDLGASSTLIDAENYHIPKPQTHVSSV